MTTGTPWGAGRDARRARWRLALALGLAVWPGTAARSAPMTTAAAPVPADGAPAAVWRHEDWRRGLAHRGVDPRDPLAVFAGVFSQLPDAVRVGPTENYYYWQWTVDGHALLGNIRLDVRGREQGELAFAYGEPREFLDDEEQAGRLSVAKTLRAADGVTVRMRDPWTVEVAYQGKTVVFHLNRLDQSPPPGLRLAPEEIFLQRTEDESGLQFCLLYHRTARYFLWVLDERDPVPENFRPLAEDAVIGRRTGFVFWVQPDPGPRKVLASVRRASLQRNDYHDGPFDQLADNFVRGDGLRPYLEEAMPWLKGRVDPWGYITGGAAPRRVALTAHGTHDRPAEAVALIEAAKRDPDPAGHLARGGRSDRDARPAAPGGTVPPPEEQAP